MAGAKAYNLRLLQKWGFRIPQTFVCVTRAYEDHQSGKGDVTAMVASELSQLVDTDSTYAVRSSTNVEDGTRHSFAGQFNTYLDVRYPDGLSRPSSGYGRARKRASGLHRPDGGTAPDR